VTKLTQGIGELLKFFRGGGIHTVSPEIVQPLTLQLRRSRQESHRPVLGAQSPRASAAPSAWFAADCSAAAIDESLAWL
jgi:hypothetical protein